MPQDYSNIESIKSFALNSVDKKLDGLLLTLWDDDSPHFELYKRGIYAFSEYTWSGKNSEIKDFNSKFFHRFFSSKLKKNTNNFIDKLDEPVRDWANLFVQKNSHRNRLSKSLNPNNNIIDLPSKDEKGIWSKKFQNQINIAKKHIINLKSILDEIKEMKKTSTKGNYTLDIYEQVAELIKFSYETFLAIYRYDNQKITLIDLKKRQKSFNLVRQNFEKVYSKTRNINKPLDYILDQDHHNHTANQTLNMDWQFIAEIELFKKIIKLK